MLIYIHNAAGTALGAGPIQTAVSWESTAALDRAGAFRFDCPASDPAAVQVAIGCLVYCWDLVNGTMQQVGAGIIETVEKRVTPEGVMLSVGGDDLLRELTYKSVGYLNILDIETQPPLKVTLDYDDGGVWQTADMEALYDGDEGTTYDIAVLEADQYVYIGGSTTLSGFIWITGEYANSVNATLAIQYWNGTEWHDVADPVDGTLAFDATLKQGGTVSWTRPDDAAMTRHENTDAYWVRIQPSANTDHMTPVEVYTRADCPSTAALATLIALGTEPVPWSLDTTPGGGHATTGSAVYHGFSGDSLLAAFERVADLTGEHFRLGTGREITWLRKDTPASGGYIVAADAGGGLLGDDPYRCVIESLSERQDAYELCTRVYPYGRGAGEARTTIAESSEAPESGYTKSADHNYVQSDTGVATYGIRERVLDFPDVGAIEDGDLHAVEGANELLRAAVEWLKGHDTPIQAYDATVVSGGLGILPGTTVQVLVKEWRDGAEVVEIVENALVCLERSITLDEQGLRVTRLTLATRAEWAKTAAGVIGETVQDFRRYRAAGEPSTTTTTTVTHLTSSDVTITGGAIDATPIGATSPSTGAFTTLSASGGAAITGDITVTGNVDGVDVSGFKGAYDSHDHTAGNPAQVSHTSLTAVSANQHHNQAHIISGADHTASGLADGDVLRASAATTFAWDRLHHDDLSYVSADQHHGQSHVLTGTDHTASGLTTGHVVRASAATAFAWAQLQHTDLGAVSANQHHNQVHVLAGTDHTASGLTTGHVLRASGVTAFAWAQLQHPDLGGVLPAQHHDPVTVGNTGLALLVQQVSLQLATDSGLQLTSGVGLGTPTTLTGDTANTVTAATHAHDITTATVGSVTLAPNAAGTGGALARADHHHQLDQGIAPIWTGAHTFQATITARDVLPELTDTYDIGSYQRWWRQQFVSAINAAVFVEATAQLLGGWFIVGHDQGTLPAAVGAADTTIDFGEAQTVGDMLVIRSHTAAGTTGVEYIEIGTLDSGTTYNVTRDLAGMHATAPEWPEGTPYLILGQTGDGRIELNAYDTPRFSMFRQGATYNAQAEVARIGDLNGDWGYGVETYGAAFGEYAAGQANLTLDPTDGLRMRTYNADRITLSPAGLLCIRDSAGSAVFTFDTSAGAEITKKLSMPGAESAIAIGAVPPTDAATGTGIWIDRTGMYGLAASVEQARFDATTGKIIAAAGDLTLDADGITITLGPLGDWHTRQAINWERDSFSYVFIGPYYTESAGVATGYYLDLGIKNTLPKDVRIGSFNSTDAPRLLEMGMDLDCAGGTATFTHTVNVNCGTLVFRGATQATRFNNTAYHQTYLDGGFYVGADLNVGSHFYMGNAQTMKATNAGGAVADTWMWPRWSDDYMYTNYGSAGWRIRTRDSGIVCTFDADGDVTFGRTVASTLGFSGPNVTSGADPGHTHTAYSATGHNHDHGALTGLADDDHTAYYNATRHTAAVHNSLALDHGNLGGRADDDHTQYLLASGARALSNNWDVGAYYIRATYFYSDIATGTRPIVCTSTTRCTNLNADMLDDLHSSSFATSTHTHTTLGALTTSGELRASYSGAIVSANTTSGGADASFIWYENGGYKHGMAYSTGGNKVYWWHAPLATTCWEILDSGTDIRGNTTWADNAFDWVCAECGWHGVEEPAGPRCPTCGGEVAWHDDAELLHLAVHEPYGVALERMERLGVLSRHADGQVFMGLQTAHLFSWSAIAQLWDRLRSAEARVAALEGGR